MRENRELITKPLDYRRNALEGEIVRLEMALEIKTPADRFPRPALFVPS